MAPHYAGLIGFLVFAVLYGLILWGALRWVRSRLTTRARLVAGALTAVGARVLEVRPSPSVRSPAEVDFELDGKRARFDVRQYGRDFILCSVRVESPPLPAILVRAEGAADRMGKALGLTREVQVGDADFDAAAYIVAAAPEEAVRAMFRSPEVQRRAREIFALGYRVEMSSHGLRATHFQSGLAAFDGAPVPAVMRALEALLAALPRAEPAWLTAPRVRPYSLPALGALVGSGLAFMGLLVGGRLVHAPLNDLDSLRALGFGLVGWVVAMVVVVRLMRDRVQHMIELFLIALALFVGVPSLVALGLFAANSGLDHGAAATHCATIVSRSRQDSEVRVVPWDRDRLFQKVGLPRPLWREVQPGDALEVDVHPGALGWPWTSGVRRAP